MMHGGDSITSSGCSSSCMRASSGTSSSQSKSQKFVVVVPCSDVQAESWPKARLASQPRTTRWAANFGNIPSVTCHADSCQKTEISTAQLQIVVTASIISTLRTRISESSDGSAAVSSIVLDLMTTSSSACPPSTSDRFSPPCSDV